MDPYKILGVEKNAAPDEIKSAYRKLAAKHHPDRGGDTATFQEVQRAYDILSDPQKKAQWEAEQNPHMRAYHGQANPFAGGFGNNPFADIFGQMFQQPQQPRGRMYTVNVFIKLEQVANGGQESIHLNTPQGPKLVNLDIPQGLEDGQQVKYDNIMPDGSLIVAFRIQPHERFERRGLDLQVVEHINIFELIAGTKIITKDIYGNDLEMNIPPMTKPEAKFRLQSKGLRAYGNVGDQYVLIQPTLPDTISSNLRHAIIMELATHNKG